MVHSILYIRRLYPESIFAPKRKYGIVVFQSIHPELNEYISECLKAVEFHAKSQRLKRFILCISVNNTVVERYVFDVLEVQQKLEE